MGHKSLEKSSKRHPNAVVSLPKFRSKDRPFDKDRQDKAVHTMETSYEQAPNGSPNASPNKASSKSSDKSSDKSHHGTATSSSYSSHDTDIVNIRESEEYIRSSDKEQRRLDRKQKIIDQFIFSVGGKSDFKIKSSGQVFKYLYNRVTMFWS